MRPVLPPTAEQREDGEGNPEPLEIDAPLRLERKLPAAGRHGFRAIDLGEGHLHHDAGGQVGRPAEAGELEPAGAAVKAGVAGVAGHSRPELRAEPARPESQEESDCALGVPLVRDGSPEEDQETPALVAEIGVREVAAILVGEVADQGKEGIHLDGWQEAEEDSDHFPELSCHGKGENALWDEGTGEDGRGRLDQLP